MIYTIHRYDSIDSTSSEALRMVEKGAPEGTVVISQTQTAGRGRRGRTWSSTPNAGLYLSLILHPHKPLDQLWQMAFIAALATAESIIKVSDLPARIKWPNDILINGRKIVGILVETKPIPGKSTSAVILGIGVNVNTADFPQEIREKASSMFLERGTDQPFDVFDVESELLSSLNSRYTEYLQTGFSSILDGWRALDCTSGRVVTVSTPGGIITGKAEGVDDIGDLLVRKDDGSLAKLVSGEVLLSPSP